MATGNWGCGAFGGYVPLNLGYTIAHCAPDYSTTIVGLPDRSNAWIMAREPAVPREKYVEELRRYTKQIQDGRRSRDTAKISQALKVYDEELERYIPVLMFRADVSHCSALFRTEIPEHCGVSFCNVILVSPS